MNYNKDLKNQYLNCETTALPSCRQCLPYCKLLRECKKFYGNTYALVKSNRIEKVF